jgi:ATP-binding cassette subfamily F protein 3
MHVYVYRYGFLTFFFVVKTIFKLKFTFSPLSLALNEYEGTVMLVSHDRALLRAVCDEFWMVSRGSVYTFEGDLDDYQQFLLDEAKRQKEEAKKISSLASKQVDPLPIVSTKKPFLSPEQKKHRKNLEKLEQQISKMQSNISALEAQLTSSYDMTFITESGSKLEEFQRQLEQFEEDWLNLSSLLDPEKTQ